MAATFSLTTISSYRLHAMLSACYTRRYVKCVAREKEVPTLARLDLQDAWHEVHYDAATREVPPWYTFGYHVHKQPHTPQLRRLDKVHVTSRLKESLTVVQAAFFGSGDHNAVIPYLPPPPPRCCAVPMQVEMPPWLLGSSAISVNTIKQKLNTIEGPDPITQWAQARKIIQKRETKYHSENTVEPPTSTLALLLASNRDQKGAAKKGYICSRKGWLRPHKNMHISCCFNAITMKRRIGLGYNKWEI